MLLRVIRWTSCRGFYIHSRIFLSITIFLSQCVLLVVVCPSGSLFDDYLHGMKGIDSFKQKKRLKKTKQKPSFVVVFYLSPRKTSSHRIVVELVLPNNHNNRIDEHWYIPLVTDAFSSFIYSPVVAVNLMSSSSLFTSKRLISLSYFCSFPQLIYSSFLSLYLSATHTH